MKTKWRKKQESEGTQKRTLALKSPGSLPTTWPSCCSWRWFAAASSKTPSGGCSTGAWLPDNCWTGAVTLISNLTKTSNWQIWLKVRNKKKSCFRIETLTTTDSDSNLLTGSSKNFDSAAFFLFFVLSFKNVRPTSSRRLWKPRKLHSDFFSLYLKLD